MFVDVGFVFDEFVAHFLADGIADCLQFRDALNRINDEVKAVEIVEDDHIERRGRRAFFLVAANVELRVIGAAVGQAVNQPRVAVKGENDGFVFGEQRVEIRVGESVRMFFFGLQFHQVDDVDNADFEVGKFLPQNDGCNRN